MALALYVLCVERSTTQRSLEQLLPLPYRARWREWQHERKVEEQGQRLSAAEALHEKRQGDLTRQEDALRAPASRVRWHTPERLAGTSAKAEESPAPSLKSDSENA